MSSYKILRNFEEHRPFTLEQLGTPATPDPDQFRAVPLGWVEPPPPVEEPPEPVQEELPPTMLEEEALRRIEEAYQEGLKEGKRLAEMELATVNEALAEALMQAVALREEIIHSSEEDLLRLSLAIARKVILKEISVGAGVLEGMVAAAVELASGSDRILVRLHPDDYRRVSLSPEFAPLSNDSRRVELKGDPALPPAGCLVETVRGNIDAGVDSQLEEIQRRLAEEKWSHREVDGAD